MSFDGESYDALGLGLSFLFTPPQRRFYLDEPWHRQLLPYLLKHNPKKFLVHEESNSVDFLEIYSKDVSES